jgi:hypothetical protein
MLFYRNLICKLDDSEESTEAPQKPAKSKHVDRNATASGTNKSKDLLTAATTTSDKCRKLDVSLLKTRRYALYTHTIDTLQHPSLNLMSSALDHSATSFLSLYIYIIFRKQTVMICFFYTVA